MFDTKNGGDYRITHHQLCHILNAVLFYYKRYLIQAFFLPPWAQGRESRA